MTYAYVILPLALDAGYHYIIPDRLIGCVGIGHRVSVHFGVKRIYTAIVVDISKDLPKDVSAEKLRFIDDILDDKPILSKDIIDLMWWMSDYYICPIGVVLQQVIPNELLPNSQTIIRLNRDFISEKPLSSLQNAILDILSQAKGYALPINKIQEKINTNAARVFEQLVEMRAIYQSEYLYDTFKPKTQRCVHISEENQNQESVNCIINKLGRAKSQQKVFLQILDSIYEGVYQKKSDSIYSAIIPVDDITKGDKNISVMIRNLIKKGVLNEYFLEVSRISENGTNIKSEDIFDYKDIPLLSEGVNFLWAYNSKERENDILIRIRQTLDSGKNVVLLSPSAYDLPSSRKFIDKLENVVLPNKVFYYHRFVSSNKKIELFKTIRFEEKPFLVVGTRSALFLPVENLGLIIVDQEHEFLYKEQMRSPRYHTRDVTIMRAFFTKAKTLLASETPSVETVFNSLRKKYFLQKVISTSQNTSDVHNVFIDVVDIAKERKQRAIKYDSSISNVAQKAISEILSSNQKVLILQNRKGYIPYMICNECGESITCPNCDVSLNYHRERALMVCHYCGYQSILNTTCDKCGYSADAKSKVPTFRSFGFGSQKVEDEIKNYFPNANILRIDGDSLQNKQQRDDIHKKIEIDEVDIIVATPVIRSQPIWNNIGLIVVVQLESIIGFPDFRATERAYQFIYNTMSSASSGKLDNDLKMIVQTNNIENPFVEIIKSSNYNKFVHTQLAERELFKFSPFYRLTKIIMKDRDKSKLSFASSILYSHLKNNLKNSIVSPVYTPSIAKIDNRYYEEILIRRPFDADYRKESIEIKYGIHQLSLTNKSLKTIDIVVDRDPL